MFREPFDISKRISKHDKYLTKPTEVHARLNELRSQYNLGPTVTQSQVDKIISDGLKGKTNVQSRFFELLKDNKSLTNLFNTAMGISAPIAAASQLQEQKQGGQTSWLNKYNNDLVNQESDWLTKYLYSFYWSTTIMTTVGFGDILPRNDLEVIVVVLAMYLSAWIFSYSLNTIG
jgi:hypothetical protein